MSAVELPLASESSGSRPPEEPKDPGLTADEAARRLRELGPNRVAEQKPRPIREFLAKFSGPVPWMLEASLALELALRNGVESAIIAALLVANATLAFAQERRAQAALELLRTRLAVLARARRDGRWIQVPADNVVPGDVLYLRMGDFVPADVRLLDGEVQLDQSALTGESMPVEAHADSVTYAGSVVRRGEATVLVTATGARSYFGKTAELVKLAKSQSQLQRLIVGIVKTLLVLDGALALVVVVAAVVRSTPLVVIVPFVLMLLIASVPIALPATFTLASAIGAVELARRGALVTRLAALEEAAAMRVLCSDKTGTLTENRLSLVVAEPRAGVSRSDLLRFAALACDDSTQDPFDLAILRAAGSGNPGNSGIERLRFVPFDPSTKRTEALLRLDGRVVRVVKGAPQVVVGLTGEPSVDPEVEQMAAAGHRVLAVASGGEGDMRLLGLLGFMDPVRTDSRALIERLRELGVRTVMVTGDTQATARAVARQLALGDRVCTRQNLGAALECDVLAGVLPEDKYSLVQTLQRAGNVVGMTGDGVNDAPALKQAEVGIAVQSATDVAKAASSIVLTGVGLSGIVAAIETGRRIYQRMSTYTLNKIVKTLEISLFLSVGFLATGKLVTTPRLILLLLLTNDFVTMSIAGDRVSISPDPDRWDVRTLVRTASGLATAWLAFSFGVLLVAMRVLRLDMHVVQTLAFLVLVLGGQANVYLVRERGPLWRSRPSAWMLVATVADLALVGILSVRGILMAPVPVPVVIGLSAAVAAFMLALDFGKVRLGAHHSSKNAVMGSRSRLAGPAKHDSANR